MRQGNKSFETIFYLPPVILTALTESATTMTNNEKRSVVTT